MKGKKIAIVGIGGRTGSMFAFELSKSAEVVGVARQREKDLVNKEHLEMVRSEGPPVIFQGEVIREEEFNSDVAPDIIMLATRNPVGPPINYYFQKCGDKSPVLIISQNGIAAIREAKQTLKTLLGVKFSKVRIVRIVLFNPIDKTEDNGKFQIHYSLPIKGAFAQASGPAGIEDIEILFKEAGFDFQKFLPAEAMNLEFSKLFLNLIGMSSASRGLSVIQGFSDKEVFKEEVLALKEYIKAVKKNGGKFLNFTHYPVKWMARFLANTPLFLLVLLRKRLARAVSKEREGKPKVLGEIDYYNGAVVDLGAEAGLDTSVNKEIYQRVIQKGIIKEKP